MFSGVNNALVQRGGYASQITTLPRLIIHFKQTTNSKYFDTTKFILLSGFLSLPRIMEEGRTQGWKKRRSERTKKRVKRGYERKEEEKECTIDR